MTKKKRQRKEASQGRKFDPELKEAMMEIKAILEKREIGGMVVLSSQTHSEYLLHTPDWSCVKLEERKKGPFLRFRSKLEDFNSREEQHYFTTVTVFFLDTLEQGCLNASAYFKALLDSFQEKQKVEIERGDYSLFNATPDEESIN